MSNNSEVHFSLSLCHTGYSQKGNDIHLPLDCFGRTNSSVPQLGLIGVGRLYLRGCVLVLNLATGTLICGGSSRYCSSRF